MTQLLEKALAQVHELPADEQDAIAALILRELEDEQRWQISFANSQDQLAQLARQAHDEFRAGKTRPLDVDDL
jgi:hypothetical protein